MLVPAPSMASIPIYLSSTNSNTVSFTKPPPFHTQQELTASFVLAPKSAFPPFTVLILLGNYYTWVTFVSPLSWSLQRRECLINHLCPAPHSFPHRTLASVAWFSDWQPTGAASCLSCLHSFSCLQWDKEEPAAEVGLRLLSRQTRLWTVDC